MNNIVLVDERLEVNFFLCGLALNLSLSFLVGSYQDVFPKSVQQLVCRKNAVWVVIIDAVLLWCTTQWMGFLNTTAETKAVTGL